MKSKTTIEVNGKQYDAVTGAVVADGSPIATPRGHNIDGFFRSRTTSVPTRKSPPVSDSITVLAAPSPRPQKTPARGVNHTKRHTPEAAKTVEVRVKSGVHHSQKLTVRRTPIAPNHTKAVKPQHSQTLMRTAVKPPKPSFYKQAGTQSTLQHAVPSLIVNKKSVVSVDSSRLARAQQTERSPRISHHTAEQPASLLPQFGPLAVQPVPVKPEGHEPSTPPAPHPDNKPTDMFEHALANANHFVDIQSQKLHFRKKARRHVASMAAGTLALFVIAGFAFYQNSPGLQFKVASYHAGVATHMPNLSATGFAYEGARAENGKLVVGLSGASGNYRLSQEATNLSAQDLIQNIGATDASGYPDYRSVQSDDVTIYRFSNTDATWVRNGTLYTVNGSGNLTDQQVESLVRNT